MQQFVHMEYETFTLLQLRQMSLLLDAQELRIQNKMRQTNKIVRKSGKAQMKILFHFKMPAR